MTHQVTKDHPLVVDLDGTLIRSDVLHEDLSAYLLRNPLRALNLVSWAKAGIAPLKHSVAAANDFDPAALQYNTAVLDWLREEKLAGRTLVLATATTAIRANAIAHYLGIFDEVISSSSEINLKSTRKRDALIERFGDGGYEYIGNHKDDVAVWSCAAVAHVVGRSDQLVTQAQRNASVGRVILHADTRLADLIKTLRPHQWLKNLLVFIALCTAQDILKPDRDLRAAVMFICFCLVASAVYVINDMSDLADDRHHETKRNRPFASGRVSLITGWLLWPLLLLGGFALCTFTLSFGAVMALLGYFVTTVAYTFLLKRKPIVDVIALALLYTIRIVAGAAAIRAPMTLWLLTFSMSIFTSLALVKRVSELGRLRELGITETRGRGYTLNDLDLLRTLGVAAAYSAVIVLALFVNDPTTSRLYRAPDLLWCEVPILLFWCSRLWLLTDRGQIHEDPVLFAVRDHTSWFTIALTAAVFAAAKFIH